MSTTPRKVRASEVEYLAFEGGGGKGVTYLGAVLALEELKILDPYRESPSQIKGFAGASAGAITALLLCLGYNAKQIWRINQEYKFTWFFDEPKPGISRGIDRKNLPYLRGLEDGPEAWKQRVQRLYAEISDLGVSGKLIGAIGSLGFGTGIMNPAAAFLVAWLIRKARDKGADALSQSANPILSRLGALPDAYLYNLVFDRGLFPGIAVRKFFKQIIGEFLWVRKEFPREEAGRIAETLTFSELYDLTRTELVISGMNVTQRRPALFSRKLTPAFPVAEAVAISMNLPLIFKPIWCDALVPGNTDTERRSYTGYWVDGGLLNNLPIHSFDEVSPSTATRDPGLRTLNPRIVGLRLTEGFPDRAKNVAAAEAELGTLSGLGTYLGDLVEGVLYPSEAGQLRTPQEVQQTIQLYSETLSTTDFSPSRDAMNGPIRNAKTAVKAYFRD